MLGGRLTARERKAVWDRCRVCGELKLCDKGSFESYLARRGKTYEQRWSTDRSPRGRVCIDCRVSANEEYSRERGLNPYKATTNQWFGPFGRQGRHAELSHNQVNPRQPLWHQLPKEVRPLADRMLEERLKAFHERRGFAPNVHHKYLLVANVIRSLRHPIDSLHRNHVAEVIRRRREIRGIIAAKERGRDLPVIPAEHRLGQTSLVGI